MSVVGEWLQRSLLVLILALAGLGLAAPAPARGAVSHHGITIALIVLVAAVGLGLQSSAIVQARKHAGRVAIMVIAGLIGLPAIAFAASRLVPSGGLRLGVLAAGVAPSEVASVALAALAGGSVALSAAVLIGSTIGCVLFAGPILHLLAGPGTSFSSVSLLLSLVGIVGVPLTLAALTRSRLPVRRHADADAVSSVLASIAVLVLIWLVAGQAHLGSAYLRAALALLAYLAGSTVLAALLTVRLAPGPRISLLLPVAMRDFAIAAGIASQAFGSSAAAALGLYGVLVLLLGAARARFAA
jgi:predicted Na+-dependent transporter